MRFVPGVATTAEHGRLFLVGDDHVVAVERDGDRVLVPEGRAGADAIFLGELDGTPCFARRLEPEEDRERAPLRQLHGVWSDADFGLAGRALGLVGWDRDHRFCGRCGGATERSTTERSRVCTRCRFGVYPRISPAVIVLVERGGAALLARSSRFPLPFFSTLAGFVEVGETLEETVAREVHEESGIVVTNVRYFGSQPWPFGGSLMVGFVAEWASGEIVADPVELAEAGWFGPNELPRLPPKLSIARALIDDFVTRRGGDGGG